MNIKDLIPKLLETTRKKKITWREVMDDTFISRIAQQKFQVSQGVDEDSGDGFYRFSIYAGGGDSPFEGRFIDTIVADRFRGPYSDLEELYSEARRNALGLDEIISDIDNELAKLLK